MKKIVFYATAVLLLFTACKTELEKVCDMSDPMNGLLWLTEKKGVENIRISKAIFKDKEKKKKIEGFIISPNKTYPDAVCVFYNCSGESLCSSGGITEETCERYEVVEEEVIYMTESVIKKILVE